MNIEEAIDVLKNSIADYVIGEYCEKCADNKICDDRNEDCYFQQAIDIIVTAYEKEKEKNKTLEELLQGRLFELYKYYKDLASKYQGNCVSKDKIKAKVEELKQKKYILSSKDSEIEILQSLLDEEEQNNVR